MNTSEKIWLEIQDKLGFVPPLFEPVEQNPQVLENMWQQTLSAYINNPLSALFKEKLAVYLSRYSTVSYCLICHSCSLHSLGFKGKELLELLELPPPTKTQIDKHLQVLAAQSSKLTVLSLNAALEESLLYCSIFISLQREQAEYCRNELRRLLGDVNYQHLIAFVAYVKTSHVWLEAYPEVSYEADKRAIDNLDSLINEEPGLADFFQIYLKAVRRDRSSWAEQRLVQLVERTRHQQALWESEERFRLLVEGVKDYGIFMLNPKGYITSWNAGAQRITGYQASEIVGKHFSYFYKYEDIERDKPDRELQIAAAEGRVEDEGWRVRQDGSHFSANVVITALRDEAGNLKGFSNVTRDITERQRHELALQQSEERLRLALKAAHMGTWDWNILSGKISYSVDAAANLGLAQGCSLGYEVTCNSFLQIVHPEDREMVAQAARRTMEENANYDIEFRVIWSDGTVHWIASKGQVCYYDDTGSLSVRVLGVNMDISLRKQIEAALRESEERFQAFMNNSPTLAYMKDQEGRYVYVNRPFEHLFKPKVDNLQGKTDFDWLPEETARQMRENDLAVISTNQPVEVLETVPSVEGYSHHWLVFKFPFHDANGRRLVGGVAVDVTARQRAEAEVYRALAKEKELSELKSHFISTTSHEFRTPLAIILSSADMIELYGHKWDESKKLEHMRRIQTAAEHMTELLDNVLVVSKAEAGKLQFKPAPMDLSRFCRDLVEEMQLIAGNKHAIRFITQGQCTNVCLDERLLRHILTNLLSNAIKYSPQGGTVEFNLLCDQVAAFFSIKDNGIGIPEADQAQLFQSFHRGSNVGATSGTGLGLAIVKKSVDLHGGEIAVNSEVGVGTKFTVTIPLQNWGLKNDNDSSN